MFIEIFVSFKPIVELVLLVEFVEFDEFAAGGFIHGY